VTRPPLPREAERAARILPGPDWAGGRVEEGGDDHLVLIPGDPVPPAVLRIARRPEVGELLPARTELLARLAPHLPWVTPVPLGEVDPGEPWSCGSGVPVPDDAWSGPAVALSWVGGGPHAPHVGDPAALRRIVEAVAAVPVEAWTGRVAEPFTSTPHWDDASRAAVLAVLPAAERGAAQAVWSALEAFRAGEAGGDAVGLVHGDLAGHNMHWSPAGPGAEPRLLGIIDWDHAAAWDPAINLAHLALWHGVGVIAPAAPDTALATRASVWVGHLALFRLRRAAESGAVRRWDRLLRKTLPRLEHAAGASRSILAD